MTDPSPCDVDVDVLVIGAGQAGLALGWHLRQQQRTFALVDAGPEVGHVWRSRWDSLRLFTPAQYDALPGTPFPAPAGTYPTKDQVADYLRGLSDFDGAEREFKKAISLDGRRGEALYNLGVLYKDFRATKQTPQESIATYNTAKQYFQEFQNKQADPKDIAEAKEQVALISKTVAQTQKFLQTIANQPPAPAAPAGGGTPPKN